MENTKWYPVYYNGLETNLEVTKCGKVKKIRVDWMTYKTTIGEINLTKLKVDNNGYIQLKIQIKGLKPKTIRLHQLVALTFLGYEFNYQKSVVDHIDSNILNNHVDNLRIVSHRENMSKERTIKSGFPVGVWFYKERNKFISRIYINDKLIYIGSFDTPEEASQAYQNKLKTIY